MFHAGPLGDAPAAGSVSVWAPTAQSVQLLHFADARGELAGVHDMARDERGVWSLPRPPAWNQQFYLFR